MTKHLLLIGCGFQGLEYIETAREMNMEISLMVDSQQLNIPNLDKVYRKADNLYYLSSFHEEEIVKKALDINKENEINGVIGYSEPHIRSACIVAETLGLKSPGLYATSVSQNKSFQRSIMENRGLLVPKNFTAYVPEVINHLDNDSLYVIKPLDKAGSIGVEIQRGSDLKNEKMLQELEFPVQVEEFIDGQEYSIETLVQDNEILFENITTKEILKGQYPIEKSHTVPSDISRTHQREILKVNSELIDLIKMESGIIHLEIKINNNQVYIIEFAVRTPGGYILNCINNAYNFNIFKAIIEIAIGEPPREINNESNRIGYAEFLTPVVNDKKRINSIKGISTIQSFPGIERFFTSMKEGECLSPIDSGLKRPGYYLATFSSYEEKSKTTEKVRETLVIEVD
ncbi:ATP-grasp domain-containing protein [Virgibacillus xinjiangensis]|uniref:ATP-grasp domain-containing protein n=1 Tax=Virgibacillus xinjiangensis TaxID=393090 RepID=A0ABV7CTY3_9BACI